MNYQYDNSYDNTYFGHNSLLGSVQENSSEIRSLQNETLIEQDRVSEIYSLTGEIKQSFAR